jgi:16S rRNA (uracil1498-N3)-methyltransferase
MDILIEKATELGIHKFHIFASKYTNYFTDNTSRWDRISRQAIKQSQRLYLPEIKISANFSDFLRAESDVSNKLLADQNSSTSLLEKYKMLKSKSKESILFLIGPEGGFDEDETKLAMDYNFLPVSFGENRLRSETAAISAASYINLIRN